nr:MAG TPA: hypothetical protein [Caudoviricetes sp.]
MTRTFHLNIPRNERRRYCLIVGKLIISDKDRV